MKLLRWWLASIADSVFSMEFYNEILAFAESYEAGNDIRSRCSNCRRHDGLSRAKRHENYGAIVIVVIALVLYAVLRSLRYTFATLAVVLFSTIWVFGLMAVLGISIYAVTIMIPVMLIAIGVADGIHLYNHLQLFYGRPSRSRA